ncbi:MAG: PD40 domain-containing protein [Candidatus Coatesbacteria bacterium]|nr:MAG: PD40 domain-containing protein [Candidatus Coatesbacteria bacterium]
MKMRLFLIASVLIIAAGAYADWAYVENLGAPPNTAAAEKQPGINGSGTLLVYNSGGNLYLTQWSGGAWSAPSALPASINNGSSNATPCWNGNMLYYSSDRADGEGGWDLWSSEWNGTTFAAPTNLGPGLNTTANETSPALNPAGDTLYFRKGTDIFYATKSGGPWSNVQGTGIGTGRPAGYIDGTLYFSDDRAGGEGGLDIWLAVGSGSSFSAAVNLGTDINTSNDELGGSWTTDKRWMHFSSDRPGGEGGYDLYRGRFTMTAVKAASLGKIKATFE